jgi:hypothetical protein
MEKKEKVIKKYSVVHPLFDKKEKKCDVEGLGRMKMSACVKYALLSLRVYLILMAGLVVYRGLHELGVF